MNAGSESSSIDWSSSLASPTSQHWPAGSEGVDHSVRAVLFKARDFFTRPLVERVAQLDQQIRQHGDALHAMTSDSRRR